MIKERNLKQKNKNKNGRAKAPELAVPTAHAMLVPVRSTSYFVGPLRTVQYSTEYLERRGRTRYGDGVADQSFADACMLLHEALVLQRRSCLYRPNATL